MWYILLIGLRGRGAQKFLLFIKTWGVGAKKDLSYNKGLFSSNSDVRGVNPPYFPLSRIYA